MWIRKRALIGTLVTLCAIGPGAWAQAPGEEDFKAGQQAYRQDDLITAMEHLNRAVEKGHVEATYFLGYVLDKAEENEEAAKMYQRAAEQGNHEAQLALGGFYAVGEGVEKNIDRARELIEQAANAGHVPAMIVLAKAYQKGDLGLQKDLEAARRWLERGIELGDESAKVEMELLEKAAKQ
ncbi:MAG: hypothetical protein Kow006_09680 [Gammaproteobacteria bacterium]